MPASEADERSTIIATYSTRRDADVARDYLDDENIETFVSSDDAGGKYPQMQRPNGVKLIGMEKSVSQARSILDEADLLPDDVEHRSDVGQREPATEDGSTSPSGWWFAGVAIVIVVLVILGMVFTGSM